MKKIFFLSGLMLLLAGSSCKKEIPDGCIDESKKGVGGCTTQWDPVCGCNNKTYGNSCEADLDGVVSYKKGACK